MQGVLWRDIFWPASREPRVINLRKEREEKCRLEHKPRVHCLLPEAFAEGPMAHFLTLLMPCFYDFKTILTSAPPPGKCPHGVWQCWGLIGEASKSEPGDSPSARLCLAAGYQLTREAKESTFQASMWMLLEQKEHKVVHRPQ